MLLFQSSRQSAISAIGTWTWTGFGLLLLASCEQFEPAPVDFDQGDVIAVGEVRTLDLHGRILSSLPVSGPGVDVARAELGRLLFWDPILSGDRDVACATCHLPEHAYTDGLPQSIGVGGQGRGADRTAGPIGSVTRNAQTVLNTVWNGMSELGSFDFQSAPMFWDNRTMGLDVQAIEPIESRKEMRGEHFSKMSIETEIVARLTRVDEYRVMFIDVYGDDRITMTRISDALAAFQSTLVANRSPFDRWMRGEPEAMNAAELSGMQEFVLAGCADCHSGPLFSDFELHVLGLAEGETGESPDVGGGRFDFRTPSLRQLAFTAPYFHAGQRNTLASAVNFYDERRRSENPSVPSRSLDPKLRRVPEMDNGRGAHIARFLDTLNDPDFDRRVPQTVPSGLEVGGRLSR